MKTSLRSMTVSLATSAIDAVLFAVCTLVLAGGAALLAARWICGALGGVCNFTLNRYWAFPGRRGLLFGQATRYAVAAVLAVTLATGAWWLLHALTGWDPRLLHLLSMAIVWVGFTYPVLRRWVFVSASDKPEH